MAWHGAPCMASMPYSLVFALIIDTSCNRWGLTHIEHFMCTSNRGFEPIYHEWVECFNYSFQDRKSTRLNKQLISHHLLQGQSLAHTCSKECVSTHNMYGRSWSAINKLKDNGLLFFLWQTSNGFPSLCNIHDFNYYHERSTSRNTFIPFIRLGSEHFI